MSESFDIKRISLGGPIFDIAKLKWLNGRYLREQMTTEEVLQRMIEWKANPDFFGKILPLALKRLETLSDFFPLSQFLLNDSPEYPLASLIGKLDGEDVAKQLKVAEWEMEKIPNGPVMNYQPFSKNFGSRGNKTKTVTRSVFCGYQW